MYRIRRLCEMYVEHVVKYDLPYALDNCRILLKNNADIKNVWEISRFNHLFVLGKAFIITEEKKYYNEFRKEIISWEKANPFAMSVNWTCTMEVAIRAINIIFAYFHFLKYVRLYKKIS